jgi:hypothetical protein
LLLRTWQTGTIMIYHDFRISRKRSRKLTKVPPFELEQQPIDKSNILILFPFWQESPI